MITIDWITKIISVPKADMTLIQSVPTEIRELNINDFRIALKDIEDNVDGMANLDTHQHNTEVLLSGITYARVFEIINGYTITFEAGTYSINAVGANSNISDVVNPSAGVTLNTANSAGLISTSSIEFASWGTTLPEYGLSLTSDWKDKDNKTLASIYSFEEDYLNVFEINMLEGRFFSQEFPSDPENSVVINKLAANTLLKELS